MKKLLLIIAGAAVLSCDVPKTESKESISHITSQASIDAIDSAVQATVDSAKKAIEASVSGNVTIEIPDALKVDSLQAKTISSKFKKSTDDFNEVTWYKPKSAPTYSSSNGIYVYFGEESGNRLVGPRLRIQYRSSDWLFIRSVKFKIDDQTFTFIPREVKRDNGSGDIWEWSDDYVEGSVRDIVLALANAKSAKMRLNGTDYYDDRTISKAQLQSIKESVQLFLAKGGKL